MTKRYKNSIMSRILDSISSSYRVSKKQHELEKQKEILAEQKAIADVYAQIKKENAIPVFNKKTSRYNVRTEAKFEERRLEPRYNLKSECEIIYQRKMYKAVINDISNSGASITFHSSVLPYTIYTLESEIDFVFQKRNYPICNIKGIVKNVVVKEDTVRIGLQIIGGKVDIWRAIVATLDI